YQKAIDLKPDFAQAHNNLGNALFSIEGRRDIDKGLRSGYAEAYAHLDTTGREMGAFGHAIASFKRALDINPDLAEAHNNMGNVLKERRWLDDATQCYEKALALNPDFAEAHSNLGGVFHDLGRLEKAEQCFRQALKLEPTSPIVLIELGKVLRDIGFGHRRSIDDLLPELDPGSAAPSGNYNDPKTKQALWDEVLECADRVLAADAGNTAALGLKTTAYVGAGRDEEGAFLSDFERFMQVGIVDVPPGYDSLETFNEALFQRLDADPEMIAQPHEQSMSGGKRFYNLQRDGENSPIYQLMKIYDEALVRYLDTHPIDPKHPFLAQRPKTWTKDIFANIWEGQGHVRSHIHPDSWITACYYARLPDVMETENQEHQAWIEFGRPPDYLANRPDPAFPVYQPQEGLLVMWPSYLYHQTIPFQSGGIRSSIPCDFLPTS
ncbi:MAG: tetratricopeptide repeat protein, partial [Rhodospirillales bacterium]